jgi:diaminopimelate decarboxylase
MDFFNYQQGSLYAEDVPVATIAKHYGTPCYIYSRATLERHWHAFDNALDNYPHLICYAVKANSNLAVLQVLARLGSGFDIVSLGELERVLAAGGQSNRVVFSGVGKLAHEIEQALAYGIFCFNVESAAELEIINNIAQRMGKIAPIALRINPDIDAKTHPYISTGLKQNKFGVALDQALPLYMRAASLAAVRPIGMACHLGSQITDLQPFLAALDRLLVLQQQLQAQDIALSHLDLGGGLGIRYHAENPPQPTEYAAVLLAKLRACGLRLILEPGRAIAGNSGILVTQVIY